MKLCNITCTPYLWMFTKMVEKTPQNALKDGGENDETPKISGFGKPFKM